MFSFCAEVSFSVTTRHRSFIHGINLGQYGSFILSIHLYLERRPAESSEPYLMLTCISWFTALRKKCSVSALSSVSQYLQVIEASYLVNTYIWARPPEISEPYLMLTYISWFTALRKKCSVSVLRSVCQ